MSMDNNDDDAGGSHQYLDSIMLTCCLDDMGRSGGLVELILEHCRNWYNRRDDDRHLGYTQDLLAVEMASEEVRSSF